MSGGLHKGVDRSEVASIDVWYARTERFDADDLRRCHDMLSADEHQRLARFLSEEARRLFLIARGMSRTLLGAAFEVAPESCRFAYDGTRPRLEAPLPPPGFDFNLSHTSGMVAVALARGQAGVRVGVDVESVDRPWHQALPRRFFSAEEIAALQLLDAPLRQRRFYEIWTLKEAYLKARGDGLTLPLDGFTVDVSDASAPTIKFSERLEDAPEHWSFHLSETAPGCLLAIAATVPGATPVHHEFAW